MRREVEICTTWNGYDATLRVEYEITYWGSPPVIDYVWGGQPAEPPEWCIQNINLSVDLDSGKEFVDLAISEPVEQAILKDISSIDSGRRGRRGRRYWED